MKKTHVIKNQTSGIKWYKHVESFVGVDKIIEETINISKQHPDVWVLKSNPNRWANVHWAFMNAFGNLYDDPSIKIPRCRNNGVCCFNLDEVLTDQQIDYIKKSLGIVEPYVDNWIRK